MLGFRRFDAVTGKPLDATKSGGGSPGGAVVVSGDGKRAVVAHTGILTIRDAATGKAIQELKPPAGFGTFSTTSGPHVTLSGDGKIAAHSVTNLKDNVSEVLVWDVDKNVLLAQFQLLQKGGALPVLSADGKLLATRGTTTTPVVPPGGKEDDRAHDSSLGRGREERTVQGPRLARGVSDQRVAIFARRHDARRCLCGRRDRPVGREDWKAEGDAARAHRAGRCESRSRPTARRSRRSHPTARSSGGHVADGKPLATTEPPGELPPTCAQGLAFVDNDRVVAWGSTAGVAVAWESPSGKFLRPPGEHTAGVHSIAFADGGKQIVTSGLDGRLVKWDAATGKPVGTFALQPRSRSLAVPGASPRSSRRTRPAP